MTYAEVVKIAKEVIRKRTNYRNRNVIFAPCPVWKSGDQINLWTYWQGYQLTDIDKKGVDILLVGQDWGCSGNHLEECNRINAIQAGKDMPYIS